MASGKEDYTNLQNPLNTLIEQVKEIKAKGLTIAGYNIPVKLFWCADMKFTNIIFGLKSHRAHHSCIYCTAKSKDYHTWVASEKRILTSEHDHKMQLGQIHQPLLPFEPEDIIIDELHWVIRIGGAILKRLKDILSHTQILQR